MKQKQKSFDTTQLSHIHFIWGAKECIFKAYGRKEVDFRQNIQLEMPTNEEYPWKTLGHFNKDEKISFNLTCLLIFGYYLVFAEEKSPYLSIVF